MSGVKGVKGCRRVAGSLASNSKRFQERSEGPR